MNHVKRLIFTINILGSPEGEGGRGAAAPAGGGRGTREGGENQTNGGTES